MTDMSPLLPLEGGFNLRDMGGYATADGRTLKHGMLYRSGIMSMLTEADERHLAGLGIVTVCDLRRANERASRPTRWCGPAGVHYLARDYSESSGVFNELLDCEAPTLQQARDMMIAVYREILVDHAPSYAAMFARMLDGHVPLLFNCTAGKDRTGVAAALILWALGVPRETILEDYLLTNRADFSRMLTTEGRSKLRRIPADVLAQILAADPDYLDAMFAELDRSHGGIDAYLAGLGVDDAAKAKLRDRLLD